MANFRKNNCVQGFTLVELSIVLVIIGLIVSGLVGGQSLIKSAKITKVVSEIELIKTAIRTFELQYNQLPGDMADAEDYWPTANRIENGKGSGHIANGNMGDPWGDGSEFHSAFQHLQLAGLIAGEYSQQYSLASGEGGLNMLSAFEGAEYEIGYYKDNSIYQENGHYIMMGGRSDGRSDVHENLMPVHMTAELDKKMDDGLAGSGRVKGYDDAQSWLVCVTGRAYSEPSVVNYQLSRTSDLCQVAFKYD